MAKAAAVGKVVGAGRIKASVAGLAVLLALGAASAAGTGARFDGRAAGDTEQVAPARPVVSQQSGGGGPVGSAADSHPPPWDRSGRAGSGRVAEAVPRGRTPIAVRPPFTSFRTPPSARSAAARVPSMTRLRMDHQGSGPSGPVNVPVGPFSSRATRTGLRAPCSTVSVPSKLLRAVAVKPGLAALTLTFVGSSSIAKESVIALRAVFEAA